MNLRVVKLGGSLLDLPNLAERFRRWLAGELPAATVLIVGGGALADAIRRAQAVHHFDDRAAHFLCVDAMAVTARLACEILPEARFCKRADEIDRGGHHLYVADVRGFLADAADLPESWSVTSDSIAAHVALTLKADELVLLKSTLPETVDSVDQLAVAGVVDAFFPTAARAFWSAARQSSGRDAVIRLVNLRGERCTSVFMVASPAHSTR